MTAHLFSLHVPGLAVKSDATIEIGGEEHRHLARVLRMSRGETPVTNGAGSAFAAATPVIGASKTLARHLGRRRDPSAAPALASA